MKKVIERIHKYSQIEEAEVPTRFMKLTEELGEWSAAYLEKIGFKVGKTPKTSEELTDHVLEEGADTLIMVLDVLFKQGFTIKEIEARVDEKLNAWDNVIKVKEQRRLDSLLETKQLREKRRKEEHQVVGEIARPTILQNAMLCKKCGTIVTSRNVHDYSICGCENHVGVDGGGEYFKCSPGEGNTSESLQLYVDTPFDEIKVKLIWGTYGVDGDEPLKWVKLVDCTSEHLKAILENCKGIGFLHRRVILTILGDRGDL